MPEQRKKKFLSNIKAALNAMAARQIRLSDYDKQKGRVMFDQACKKGEKFLERDQFEMCTKKMLRVFGGIPPDEDEMNEAFDLADQNGDETVDFREMWSIFELMMQGKLYGITGTNLFGLSIEHQQREALLRKRYLSDVLRKQKKAQQEERTQTRRSSHFSAAAAKVPTPAVAFALPRETGRRSSFEQAKQKSDGKPSASSGKEEAGSKAKCRKGPLSKKGSYGGEGQKDNVPKKPVGEKITDDLGSGNEQKSRAHKTATIAGPNDHEDMNGIDEKFAARHVNLSSHVEGAATPPTKEGGGSPDFFWAPSLGQGSRRASAAAAAAAAAVAAAAASTAAVGEETKEESCDNVSAGDGWEEGLAAATTVDMGVGVRGDGSLTRALRGSFDALPPATALLPAFEKPPDLSAAAAAAATATAAVTHEASLTRAIGRLEALSLQDLQGIVGRGQKKKEKTKKGGSRSRIKAEMTAKERAANALKEEEKKNSAKVEPSMVHLLPEWRGLGSPL